MQALVERQFILFCFLLVFPRLKVSQKSVLLERFGFTVQFEEASAGEVASIPTFLGIQKTCHFNVVVYEVHLWMGFH